jgi:hypothetical protein
MLFQFYLKFLIFFNHTIILFFFHPVLLQIEQKRCVDFNLIYKKINGICQGNNNE